MAHLVDRDFFLQFWEGALGPFRIGKLARSSTKLGNFLKKQEKHFRSV